MLRAIDHVQIAIPPGGEDAARPFYRDLLGLTEVAKTGVQASRGGCWFEAGDIKVHLEKQENLDVLFQSPHFVIYGDVMQLTGPSGAVVELRRAPG